MALDDGLDLNIDVGGDDDDMDLYEIDGAPTETEDGDDLTDEELDLDGSL